jgi:hypothetical protein
MEDKMYSKNNSHKRKEKYIQNFRKKVNEIENVEDLSVAGKMVFK